MSLPPSPHDVVLIHFASQTSYIYSLTLVRSLSLSDPAIRQATLDLIATALRLPVLFDFDSLFRLDAVIAVKDDELFALLQIFMNEGLPQYYAWESSHADIISKYSKITYSLYVHVIDIETRHFQDFDKEALSRKMRLLCLATLGFQNIGRDLTYSAIASEIQVDLSEVEKWVIDGRQCLSTNSTAIDFKPFYLLPLVIRAGLLSGKLSQTSQTLRVTRATARIFEREQWALLEKRLAAWKTGLGSVLDVVAEARKKNGFVVQGQAEASGSTGQLAQVQAAAA